MAKHGKRGGTNFRKGMAFVKDGSATGKSIDTLAEGLAQDAECGCGIRCECGYSYLTLENFDSATGDTERVAVYVVDGEIKVAPIDEAKLEQEGYKTLQ